MWMQGGLSEIVAGLHLMAISHKRTTFESFAAYFPLVLAEKKAAGSAEQPCPGGQYPNILPKSKCEVFQIGVSDN